MEGWNNQRGSCSITKIGPRIKKVGKCSPCNASYGGQKKEMKEPIARSRWEKGIINQSSKRFSAKSGTIPTTLNLEKMTPILPAKFVTSLSPSIWMEYCTKFTHQIFPQSLKSYLTH